MPINALIIHNRSGIEFHEDLNFLEGSTLGKSPDDALVWVDIQSEEAGDLQKVAVQFGLHELAIEDCITPGHFPKIEDYGNHLFMILRSLKPKSELDEVWAEAKLELKGEKVEIEDENDRDEKFTRKLAIFISENFIVTFRRKEVAWLDAFFRQAKQNPDRTIALGADILAHRVIDILIDRFTRGLDFFQDLIDRMEDIAVQDPDRFEMPQVLFLKRELVWLRQIVRDQRVVIARLANTPTLLIKKQQRRYFKDIEDHADYIENAIDKSVDSLLGLRDAHFALANVRLGDTMRVLAIITTIAAPLNLVVGLYGMNFENMPMLHNPNGFWLMVGVISILTFLMLLYFRRRRWM